MNTGSIRWLAPRKHRRFLVIVIALVALSSVMLDALSLQLRAIFHSPNLLVRGLAHGTLAVWVYTWLFALVLGFPVLLLQPVPWRPESFSFRAYRVLLVLLGATELALIYTGTAGALRILTPALIGVALFLPKAIVLWTVPDVPGAWDFKTHAHHP
jgi:hypothetical protein